MFCLGFSYLPVATGVLHIIIWKHPEAKLCVKAIFRFIDEPMNWYAADQHCRRLGGLLVEIDTPEENEAIMEEMRKGGFPKKKKQFWMGLTDREVSDNVDFLNKAHLLIKQSQHFQCNIGGHLMRCTEALAFVRSHPLYLQTQRGPGLFTKTGFKLRLATIDEQAHEGSYFE